MRLWVVHRCFVCLQWLTPSTLGGNTLRVSASDAELLASAPLRLRMQTASASRSARPRGRNPITGDAPKYACPHTRDRAPPLPLTRLAHLCRSEQQQQQMGLSQALLLLPNGQPLIFPPRGTIGSVGAEGVPQPSKSPGSRAKSEKIEYELWCEAQRRKGAERELRTVQIHGRSRPPWIGDSESSGYQKLYPQTR